MVVSLIIYAEHILPLSFIKIAPESCLTDFIGGNQTFTQWTPSYLITSGKYFIEQN